MKSFNMKLMNHKQRLFFVALGLGVLFTLLIAHFYKIQWIEHESWLKEARKQHYFILKEPFTRGTFYSNTAIKKAHPAKTQKLVYDLKKYHLYADPDSIPDLRKKEIVKNVSEILDLSQREKELLLLNLQKKTRSRKLAIWLEFEEKEALSKWWFPFAKKWKIPRNALFFQDDFKRSYPFGKLLGQVLHTVQNIKDEKSFQAIPTGGLELYFDKILRGKPGKRRLMRSPKHSLELGDVLSKPENGADIYLTINHALQSIAEDELEKGVKKCKAKAGWAVMMDPKTGEILALAQYPFFYPPDYQNYFNDPLLIEHTKVKAITDANEIGSTMKPITLAIALLANQELESRGEKPLFSPEEKIATANGRFPGRSKPITDTHLHHYLNMNMALQKSSNIYMSRLVERIIQRLGESWYRKALTDVFGFGKKTGIELPSESPGVVPTPGKKHPNGTLEWSVATPFSISFGHNIQANSIQLLRAYALLANGGYFVNPTIIKKIVKENELLYENQYPPAPRKLPEEVVKRVVRALKYATKIGSTSRKGDIWGYTEAGKSSTPKKIINGLYSETVYVPSFVGFTPVENPAFILQVTMDEPEYAFIPGYGKNHNGGTCAASVFAEIARRSLVYLNIPSDDPHGYPNGDPRYDPKKADWVAETKELAELYKEWNGTH